MERDDFSDQTLHRVTASPDRDAARKVRHVGAPRVFVLFDDDEILGPLSTAGHVSRMTPGSTLPKGERRPACHNADQTRFEPSGRLQATVRSAAKGGGITDLLPRDGVIGTGPFVLTLTLDSMAEVRTDV